MSENTRAGDAGDAGVSEGPAKVRTPQDYAIEFGGYLATAAEAFMKEQNRAAEAGTIPSAEAWTALGSAIHEFRKRAAKAVSDPAEAQDNEDRLEAVEWVLRWLIEWSGAGQAFLAEVERLHDCGASDKGAVTRDA